MADSLTPDRWRRLQALFAEAADLPAPEQTAFVARVAGQDAALARELRGMLAHGQGADAAINRAIARAIEVPSHADTWIGRRVGPYKIVREIGRGGMGVVFEAVRDDEYYKRVALKIAPSATVITALDARFRLERQILAGLEHPHIARFLDGGTHDGLPYFAMEYVEGVPVTDYCRERGLTIRERLGIVRRICDALRHAHDHLVVHRDLKPTNILVTQDGSPKLLDFGIAKILAPLEESGATVNATWTPDYASPEQVTGRAISTRTDVYSLGLVLYEVLTGARAQAADHSSPVALQRSVCDHEPVRASECAAARGDAALARRLSGDLDTIVATAIRKDPERRYASVGALREDLDRYLDGRPILARPQTWVYRAGKLLRRHRLAAAAIAVIVASVAAGVVGTLYQARRAERRFQQVRALANSFVVDVHDRIAELPGATEARQWIVQTGLTYLESLRGDAFDDPALARELAAGYEKIGTVQGHPLFANLGDTNGALDSYRRAEEMLAPLERAGDRQAMRKLVWLSHNTGVVKAAQGDVAASTAAYERARSLGEHLLAGAPSDLAAMNALGDVYAEIARAAVRRDDHAAAEPAARRAMELAEAIAAAEPTNREYRNNLATAHNALGSTRMTLGRLAEGADAFRRSVEIRRALVAEEATNLEYRRALMVSYGNLGDILGFRLGQNLGDTSGAIEAFRSAAALAHQTMQEDAADQRAVFDVVNAELRLGSLLADDAAQRLDGVKHLETADRLNRGLLAREPESSRYGYVALFISRRLGEALSAVGRKADAIAHLERVRSAAPKHLDGPTGGNARTQLVLATLHLAIVRSQDADPRAVELARFVAREIADKPVAPAALQADISAKLDRLRLQMPQHLR